MESRLNYRKFNPEPLQARLAMEKYIAGCGLKHKEEAFQRAGDR